MVSQYIIKWHAFDWFLPMIPTQFNNHAMYLPRFSLLCAPDNVLKPMTSTLNFHFFSSLQSNALSFQETPFSLYLQSIHQQLLKHFLGMPTQVCIYSNPFWWNLWITYLYALLQLCNVLHKFVVKINLDTIWTWKVGCDWFVWHWDEGIAKCRVASKCEGL